MARGGKERKIHVFNGGGLAKPDIIIVGRDLHDGTQLNLLGEWVVK